MILGTAGHIDHGKTSLVRALTGIDCDRLPEERDRGITIDLGYANLSLDGVTYGIVDVPGHERFIRNMLAGATGFDVAMLIVAADDSVMPQTREHLEILSLLGLKRGVVVMTKCDCADPEQMQLVKAEIEDLVAGTFLESSPCIEVSSRTGMGIEELKQVLIELHNQLVSPSVEMPFRLPIDRSFIREGHGTIVTGSVWSGQLKIGDELDWWNENGHSQRVRVRGLHVHGEPVEQIERGQRAAINLPGIGRSDIGRGHELACPGLLKSDRLLTVSLRACGPRGTFLKHGQSVQLHVGTAEVRARVALLDANQLAPSETALAQLLCDRRVTSIWGQPFILRDVGGERTVAGGHVVQPNAKRMRRRQIDAVEHLERLRSDDLTSRWTSAVWFAGTEGVRGIDFPRIIGCSRPPELPDQVMLRPGSGDCWVHRDRWSDFEDRILKVTWQLHQEHPLLTTLESKRIIQELSSFADSELTAIGINGLLKKKRLTGDLQRVAHRDFKPRLTAAQRAVKERIVAEIRAAELEPPEIDDYATLVNNNKKVLKEIIEVAAAEGSLQSVSRSLWLSTEHEREMVSRVREQLKQRGSMTVSEIRDLLGTTRKYAVPYCEYLDRIGITVRHGDFRRLAEGPSS